jgi:hypothetical protein
MPVGEVLTFEEEWCAVLDEGANWQLIIKSSSFMPSSQRGRRTDLERARNTRAVQSNFNEA